MRTNSQDSNPRPENKDNKGKLGQKGRQGYFEKR